MSSATREGFRVGGTVAAIVGALALAVVGGQTIAANLPAPEPTPAVVGAVEPNGYAEGPEKVIPTPEPAPVVEAPPAVEEPIADVSGAPGDLVPFIPSSDPNNALGGDYIDPGIYCQNGSASGNPPVCD